MEGHQSHRQRGHGPIRVLHCSASQPGGCQHGCQVRIDRTRKIKPFLAYFLSLFICVSVCRAEQLYQKVMSLWHQLHVNMKSVVSWNYLQKDIRTISEWNLDTVRFILFSTTFALAPHRINCPPTARQVCSQTPSERQQALGNLDSHLADFLADSKESSLFTPAERREVEEDVQQVQRHCKDLLLNMETGEMRRLKFVKTEILGEQLFTQRLSHVFLCS